MLRKSLRRFVFWWGSMSLISTAVLLVIALIARNKQAAPHHDVLHVVLDGTISEAAPDPLSKLIRQDDAPTLEQLCTRITAAAGDERIVGLLLEVKHPQVGLAQLEALARATKKFEDSGKWSRSYFESAGEEGHGDGTFALASLANHIMLAPSGMVHLTGLRADVPFVAGLLDKLKVERHIEQRYEYKNFANTFDQNHMTPAHKESLKTLLDDLQGQLLNVMAEHRHTDVATATSWVAHGPFDSNAALEHHLVDEVAYWDRAEAAAEEVAGHKDALFDIAGYAPPSGKRAQAQVALIVAEGEISRGSSKPAARSDGISSEAMAEALRQARHDGVDAVLMRIDSPGGSYIASDIVRHELELTREHNIPVVVSMGNTAASGGYFIAIAADHIVAEAGTVTGSIGVVSVSLALRRALADNLGVTFDTYRALTPPADLGFLDLPDAKSRLMMGEEIDRIYRDFVAHVATARHRSYDDIHKVAKGRVWTGQQALAHGLVDELGGMEAARAYIRRRLELDEHAPLALEFYPEPPSPWTYLRQALGQQVALERALTPVVTLWQTYGAHLTRALATSRAQLQL